MSSFGGWEAAAIRVSHVSNHHLTVTMGSLLRANHEEAGKSRPRIATYPLCNMGGAAEGGKINCIKCFPLIAGAGLGKPGLLGLVFF